MSNVIHINTDKVDLHSMTRSNNIEDIEEEMTIKLLEMIEEGPIIKYVRFYQSGPVGHWDINYT